jgi:hydroxymethylbilane synthase
LKNQVIKIGTRGSKLALWQAYHVQNLLQKSGLLSEIQIIETKGDKILNVTLSKIGSKGLFTEELEEKLSSGTIDIAVHSAKDLPSTLAGNLEIVAFTKREIANDVLVSFSSDLNLEKANAQMLTIGTSSTRRVAFLKHYYPKVKVVDMRGNLQTRFEKLKNNACDGMLLAYAGVHRMELDNHISEILPLEKFIPPVGQGSVAIECSSSLDENIKLALRNAINDVETAFCLLAERSFLKTMNGGCSVPTFALAQKIGGQQMLIHAGIISLDGTKKIEKSLFFDQKDASFAGKTIAEEILSLGGNTVLAEIKSLLS